MVKYLLWPLALLVVLFWAPMIPAEDCPSCSRITFPEATEFLAANGYPSDAYVVLMAWEEVVPKGAGTLISGFHVLDKAENKTIDLYADTAGKLLDSAAQAALGIRTKNWDLAPIEQQPEIPPAIAKSVAERPVPVTVSTGISPTTHAVLSGLSAKLLEDEDETAEKGPERIGIVRDLVPDALAETIVVTRETVTLGQWADTPDGGRLWSVTLVSPGAEALRVHLASIELPSGARVVVYNANAPTEAYGPYEKPFGNDSDLWTATCFSDTVVIECFVPETTRSLPLNLSIDQLAHIYKGFDTFQWEKAAGSCNLDVTCYPAWEIISHSVAGYTCVHDSTVFRCTGTLVADTHAESQVPYFLTANHCISSQSGVYGASNMEFFWLYQTSSCNGVAPSPANVPRTYGGADLLATTSVSVGTDFTLVRLRNAPPAGTSYSGWSSDPVPIGAQTTVIHHPRGDYKRISFGHLTNTGSPTEGGQPVQPYEFFHESLWDQGTTEPTSSGSPLFLTDRKLIIGQLWGGYASCTLTNEPDYFGRFDKTFPLVEQWLAPSGEPTPTAAFEAAPLSGTSPLTVTFTDSSDPGVFPITSWKWNFGDGGTSTMQNPSHTYTREGSFAVSLEVTTVIGSDIEVKNALIAVTLLPTAAFTGSPRSGLVPLTVEFSDASTAGSSPITSWEWDFGDGAKSSEQNPAHTYTQAGVFSVSLTVTTAIGTDLETKSSYVTVSVLPTAHFTAAPSSGAAPLTVSFCDTSEPGSSPIVSWQWNFGDGGTSTERNPTHIYLTPGAYEVSLTVTTAVGSDVDVDTIPVSPAPLNIQTASALPRGEVGSSYKVILTATGGISPYTWTTVPGMGSLPPGTVLSTDGMLAGTPKVDGGYTFRLRVRDSQGWSAEKTMTLYVEAASGGCAAGSVSTGVPGLTGDMLVLVAMAILLGLVGRSSVASFVNICL